MKEMKKTWIISTVICLIPVILGIILFPQLPDQIATHWDGQGVPNGWSSKFVGAIVFPGSLAVLNLLMPVLLKMDPKYNNVGAKMKSLILWIMPAVSLVCSTSTLGAALGYEMHVATITPELIGLLFVVIGNYLPKTGQSYTVGIKIPWTLHSEENWNKTHRLAGFVWVIGGILMVILGLLGGKMIVPLFMVIVAVCALIPVVYSYLYFKKETGEQ